MNILVLGGGGREHAIAWALDTSPRCDNLYVAPGNGGTAAFAENVEDLAVNDGAAVAAWALDHDIQMVVIGPEAPLVAGVADVLRERGIITFGPGAEGAQLEGSKTFSKRFMQENNLPTAAYGTFTSADEACAYVDTMGAPIVVKADGLAAGKGVIVAETVEDAKRAVHDIFEGEFGEAGNRVVVEECLTGPECSMLAFVTAGHAFCMEPAQDHKRAFEGDTGPNTGGMGVYSPVPIVEPDELDRMRDIMQHAAAASAGSAFSTDYRGCLYGGFMLTPQGPKLLEFNARFGDPETQVVLVRLESDLVDVMEAVATGNVEAIDLRWSSDFAVCVVLASEGYPGSYEKGKVILGIDEAEAIDDVTLFHAGTALNDDGELVTAGGRVLNVVAHAKTFEAARDKAYEACDRIIFEGKQLRRDIGAKAAAGRASWEK